MTLTTNDKLFLQELQSASTKNRQGGNVTLVTNQALLSEELIKLFKIENNHSGGWFFNVYVEFEPMFKTQEAKDWQK